MGSIARFRSSNGFKVFTISCAVFTDVFLYGMVVPVIPFALRERIGVPKDQAQNVVSTLMFLFGISAFLASPPTGILQDKIRSCKVPFLMGLVGLFLAILFFWLARTVVLLCLARLIQGAATTMVWLSSLSMIAISFDKAHVGVPMSMVTLSDVLGKVISPTIGGLAYHYTGYESVFIIALSLIAFDGVLRVAMINRPNHETGRVSRDPETDPLIAPHSTEIIQSQHSSIASNAHVMDSSPSKGFSKQTDEPSPYAVFWSLAKDRQLLTAMSAFILSQLVFISVDTILPVFISAHYGFDSFKVGLSFIPLAAPAIFLPLTGKLADRFGSRWIVMVGFVLGAVSFIGLALIYFLPLADPAYLYAASFVFGVSHGLQETGVLVEVSAILEDLEENHPVIRACGKDRAAGHAYGLIGCAAGTGLTFGPLVSGLFVAKVNFGWACIANAVLCGSGVIPALLSVGVGGNS